MKQPFNVLRTPQPVYDPITAAITAAVGAQAGSFAAAAIGFGVNIAVSAVASYALNALTPKPKIPGSGGFLVNEVNPTAPAEYVYGEVRKGGVVTYDEATDDNAILHRIIVLAAGEHEVGDIYLNDEVVSISGNDYSLTDPSDASDVYTGAGWVTTEKWMEDNQIREPRIRIFVHDGSQTATTDTFANSSTATLANTLLAASANGLDASFVGKGLTYLYVQMNIDAEVFAGGVPRITAKIKRKDVYDPRDDTNKITSNWALCLADYLQADYGLGDTGSVDNTALSAEANICDEAVTLDAGGTQPRYEMNGVFRADETPGQILSRMMPSGSGQLFWGQGKWVIRAGEYAGSIASFDLSDLRSGIQVETRTPRAQNYNAVRGVFNDKSQRYIEGEYPRISSATFLSVDGGFENVLDYDLPFETDGVRAQRLAKLALYRQREQIRVEADFNMRAASVQPGDVIDLTIDRYGWTAKEFEVVGWTLKISESGTLCVRLSLKETSEASFDWNAEESVFDSNNTNLPDRFAVSTVTLGTPILSKIENPEGAALTLVTVPWSVTSPGLSSDYVFEWRENNIDYDGNGGFVEDSGAFTARERAVYDAYLKGLRRAPDQDGFDFYVTGGGSGLTALEVLVQITNSTEGQNQTVFQSVVTRNTSYELRTLKYGQRYDFRVYARNARGIRSEVSAMTYLVETDNTVPKAPTSFTATAAYQAVNLSWAAVTQNTDNTALDDLYQYQVYRNTSNSFGGATLIAELPKNTIKYVDAGLDNATLYYYWVTARDFSGNESTASTVASATTQAAVADGANGDRTYTGTVYYTNLQSGTPGLPSETGVTFNESTGTFTGGTFSATPGWRHAQPSVDVTNTSLLEWECRYRVTVDGSLPFPQTSVPPANFEFTNVTGAIQITANIESDNFNGVIDANGNITDPGTAGWAITRDGGDAAFNDVLVRGDIRIDNADSYIDTTGGGLNGVVIGAGGTSDSVGYFRHDSVNPAVRVANSGTGDALRVNVNVGGLGSGSGDGIEIGNEGGAGSTCIDARTVSGGHAQIALSSADGGYAYFAPATSGDGYLDASGGGYNPFTGVHMGMLLKTCICVPGDILVDRSIVVKTISDTFGEVRASASANQISAIGVLQKRKGSWLLPPAFIDKDATRLAQESAPEGSVVDPVLLFDPSIYHDDYDLVDINAVGEGSINVCGENGNIAVGDLIVTSSIPGKGMKQADGVVRSYTVAKAREAVTFSEPSEVRMVACIYLCG